jgi:2-hydroxychromene-2-carboxylate isomerase
LGGSDVIEGGDLAEDERIHPESCAGFRAGKRKLSTKGTRVANVRREARCTPHDEVSRHRDGLIMSRQTIKIYSDYKSPYAYLAKDLVYDLESETGVVLDWWPYTLDIPAYLGQARLDSSGAVIEEDRNAHQWRRVKYSYMDCRREASRRGIIIRGTRKIWNSSLANIGMLFAKRHGVFRAYHDRVFERFWRRELDIEDGRVIAAVLEECGAESAGFYAYSSGEGRNQLADIQSEAEAAGVFGVPSFLFASGDLYWGREHLPRIKELLLANTEEA